MNMKLFKNILYVTEPTMDQSAAVERAVTLAENNQSKLTIIDVFPPVAEDYRADTADYRQKALDSLIAPYRKRLEIRLDVMMGPLFLEVVRAVLRNGHDLVIKTAEDPDFLKRLFGSNDMHLLRKCPCPVWLMKPREKPNYGTIVAAVDFDPLNPTASEQALNREILELAGSLALTDSASLHIVHAWEALAERTMTMRGDIPYESIAKHISQEHTLHQKGLDRLIATMRDQVGADVYDRLSPRLHLPKGPPKTMIATSAAGLSADLVVMGTVARTGISGFIIGNTAEATLDQLMCSVLAVKPPGFASPVKLDP
jgi:nucleotide-binding universal stress UspA family protein